MLMLFMAIRRLQILIKFEKVKRFENTDIQMPKRGTKYSAGYDMYVAENIIIPSLETHTMNLLKNSVQVSDDNIITLEQMEKITKATKAKPTLVSTGVKCYMEPNQYLQLAVRSSTPLKYWLIQGNAPGIVDADYADNPENDGEIFFQMINLSPFAIELKKGDRIGQGVIHNYSVTDDDKSENERIGGYGSTGR